MHHADSDLPEAESPSLGIAAELDRKMQALQDSEERLRAIVSTAVDGIITINEVGIIEFANEATEKLFGYSQTEILGQNVSMLMPEPYRSGHDGYLANYAATGNRKIIGIGREVLGRRKDGSVFPMNLAVSEVKLRSQRLYTGIVRDISDRKAAEEALRRLTEILEDKVKERTDDLLSANEQLQGFTYSIAHDLRQYIRGLNTNAQIVLHDYGPRLDPEGRARLEALSRAAMKLSEMANDILEHARLGREAPARQEIDMTALAKGIAAQIRERYPDAAFHIQEGMAALGDPNMLGLALTNLLDNACKFSRHDAAPSVSVGQDERGFFVRDEGIGFEMRYERKLFQPFERLHVNHAAGSGIGLANVRRVIEKHGGEVWAESKGVDRGATFFFTLPK